jgi:hypothetical protein
MNSQEDGLLQTIDTTAGADVATRRQLIGDVEAFLRDAIQRLEPETATLQRQPGRPRILPALCLWAGLLVCVLTGFSSQLALWRLLSACGLWAYPRFAVSDQAVYKRLAAAGTAGLEHLFSQVSVLLRERLAPYRDQALIPWAAEVFALDATTLDSVARKLPALREVPLGDHRLLPGKLAGLYDIRRQQWWRIQPIGEPHQNDKVVAAQMVANLPTGSLILADLGYFAFAWFDGLTDGGYHWLSRLRSKTSYETRHVFYQDAGVVDALVWLGAYRADRAAHAVRLVSLRLGDKTYQYITNVLDPLRLTPLDMVRLYGRRWDIEMAINLVKTHLKLHLLWSAKTVVILQQMWAALIIAQILQALHLEIAGRAGVETAEVSMALLVQYLPYFAQQGQDPIAFFVEHGRAAHFIRPSRRIQYQAPYVPPDQIRPLPPDLLLLRTPRYAQRKCGRGDERN